MSDKIYSATELTTATQKAIDMMKAEAASLQSKENNGTKTNISAHRLAGAAEALTTIFKKNFPQHGTMPIENYLDAYNFDSSLSRVFAYGIHAGFKHLGITLPKSIPG